MNVFDKLILGIVHLGSNYCINSKHGQLSIYEVNKISSISYLYGIRNLDTADAYGSSIDFATKVPEGFTYDSGTNNEWENIEFPRKLIIEHVDTIFEF